MRADGTRVYNEDPMYYLVPYFLTKRYDAQNMITIDIPEAPMKEYMNRKRKEGRPVCHLALVLTAYLRALDKFPQLNRFVVNSRVYQHNDIAVSMVVLKPGGTGTMSKIYLEPKDDIFDVQDKIMAYTAQNRQEGETNGLDTFMGKIVQMGWLLRPLIGLIRWLDNVNLLPKALINISPFHASLLITNLASIRTNHIYHHLYQFGTTSIGMAMGNLREVPKRNKGEVIFERCIPIGVVMDERIASGHTFALAFAEIKKMLSNPELMERKPQEKNEDDD